MRSSLRLVAVFALGSLPFAASCADFSGDEGEPSPDAAANETAPPIEGGTSDSATPPDAAPDGPAMDAMAIDAGTLPLMADDFEFSCGTWSGVKSVLKSMATPPNGGVYACEVCSSAAETGFFTRSIDLPMAPRNGEVLLRAFVRVSAGPGPITLTSVIAARDAAVERVVDDKIAQTPINGQYTAVQNANAFLDVNKPAKTITVSFEIPANNCVLFDDVSLTFKAK